jgi:drug/metabolite transporter (DMT)-like permease
MRYHERLQRVNKLRSVADYFGYAFLGNVLLALMIPIFLFVAGVRNIELLGMTFVGLAFLGVICMALAFIIDERASSISRRRY